MVNKKMLVSDITHTIYYGNVKEREDGLYEFTGKKDNVTDEAIKAVFDWFMKNFQDNEPNEVFEVTFKNVPYVLRMTRK